MDSQSIKVLIADDHPLLRLGISHLIGKIPNASVAGEAADGRAAVEMAFKLKPDIVVMDISMPELNGIDAAARILEGLPSTKVIMLSSLSDEATVLRALKTGVCGYVLKNTATMELELAICGAATGGTYLSPEISRQVVTRSLGGGTEAGGMLDKITSRQREILQLIAEGKSTKEVAFLLNVSIKTIETHRLQMMDRLDIHDVAGLVRLAVRTGLVPG